MKLGVLLTAIVVALVMCVSAYGDTNTTLNNIASHLSGHSVTVQGYLDDRQWVALLDSKGDTAGDVTAFTVPGTPVIYLGPRVYAEVIGLADGENMGAFLSSEGILTLAHEAAHQAGITDEGAADCKALSEIKQTAIQFGIPAKIRHTYIGHKRIRIGRKHIRIPVLKHKTVLNPFLSKLQKDAMRWHVSRGPTYQGSC